MPFPFLPKRRPPLPIGGQLPMGEMSEMPEVAPSRPTPIPLARQEWRPPMVAPEAEPMPEGFRPPMALPSRDIQANNAGAFGIRTPPFMPAQISDARPSLELQRPQRAPMPDIPIGGGGATVPDNPYDRARRDYVMEGAKRNPDGSLAGDDLKFKRSGKDIVLAALAGLGRGGLLGAATGALTATIDPRTGREMNFDAFHGPQIERAEDRARQEQMRQRQEALQQLALDRGTVGLDQERAQTELYKAQAEKALNPTILRQQVRLQPMQMADGSVQLVNLEDPANEGKSFSPILKPERRSVADMLKEAEAEREVDEGSPEEIALSSYESRGGDAYVLAKLPEATRRILNGETVKELVTLKDEFGKQLIEPATIDDGSGKEVKNPRAGLPRQEMQERPATPAEVASAQLAYDRAVAAAKAQDLNYTKGEARKRAAGRMGWQAPVSRASGGGRAGGTRSLSELESKYFGGR